MTKLLFSWIYGRLAGCDPLTRIVDGTDGIRRMDKAELNRFQKTVALGRLTRAPIAGYETRPIWNCTVDFTLWVRPDVEVAGELVSGDLVLEDLEDWIVRALVIRRGADLSPQDCSAIAVLDSAFEGDFVAANFDQITTGWTKSFRLRFVVSIATCQPVLDWGCPCT